MSCRLLWNNITAWILPSSPYPRHQQRNSSIRLMGDGDRGWLQRLGGGGGFLPLLKIFKYNTFK